MESVRMNRASAAVRLIDMRVVAEEKLTKAGARISEKVVHLVTNLALGLHRIMHHIRNPEDDECLEFAAETMTSATERRLRKEKEAKERAQWERAMAREWSAYRMSRHMQHSHKHFLREAA